MFERYCLPIIKPTKAAVFSAIETGKQQYNFFEIWLDYIEDLDDAFISRLIKQLPNQVIFVFRRQQLAPIIMPLSERLRLLALLHNSSALVDLDIYSQQLELAHIKESKLNIRLIVCHHDYTQTPNTAALHQIINDIQVWQPEIVKLAAFCNREEDAVRLLNLQLELRRQGQKHIILGMGPHGIVTRIFGTKWGNELIFAPAKAADQSAPGQLTRQELEVVFKTLARSEAQKRVV